MLTNLTIQEATELLQNQVTAARIEEVSLLEALDCVLAEEIISTMDLPPYHRSPLDGYALRAEDTFSASATDGSPVVLEVIDNIKAGQVSGRAVKKGQAIRLMTGAKIPEGADAVIKYEDTEFTERAVTIFAPVKAGANLVLKGEDLRSGESVLAKGALVGPAEIGVLAALGKSRVRVFAKPRVALLATGDELVGLGDTLQDGQIRDSNTYMIAAQLKRLGISPEILGFCRDDIQEVTAILKEALERNDIVITTGGASVGDADIIKEVFAELGAELLFWKVQVKPGSPLVCAKLGDKLFFGLSGNPAAAFMSFVQFVRPTLQKAMGKAQTSLMQVDSILETPFRKVSGQNRFVRAHTYRKEGKYVTSIPEKHSSGVLSSMMGRNSMFFVPAGKGPYAAGDPIRVEMLDYLEAEA